MIVLVDYLPREYMNGLARFLELVDIICRAELLEHEVQRVDHLALEFFKHFEKCYYKFREDRLHLCKTQNHMLLHLEETIRECGLLLCTSQYVMERSIGYQVDRNNTKTLVSESLFRNALLFESYRLFYKLPFYEGSKLHEQIGSYGCVRFLGPKESCCLPEYVNSNQLMEKLARYVLRKFGKLGSEEARAISNPVDQVKLFSRVQIICGSDTPTVSAQKFRAISATAGKSHSPSCSFAAEMDEQKSSCDVYSGLLQDIFEIDLSKASPIAGLEGVPWRQTYQLILADWSNRIKCGEQGQIFSEGKVSQCFPGTTFGDASIIKRVIGVVEHIRPRGEPWLQQLNQRGSRNNQPRDMHGRRRTYFVDDKLLADRLYSDGRSFDGINSRLHRVI